MPVSNHWWCRVRQNFSSDIVAGLTVACVALPLNLALALASGVPASMGLISGVIAGLVAALLGGVRLQVTGPEAALVPAVLVIAREHGVAGVVVATCMCGLLQILLGFGRVAAFVRFVPLPVVRGFMAGIGVLILVYQLPVLLGAASGASLLDAANGWTWFASLALGGTAALCMLWIPGFGTLFGLALATSASILVRFAGPRVGALPSELPLPRLPDLTGIDMGALVPLVLSLALLASLGSMLSAAALQALLKQPARGAAYDRELVAQGVANLACGLFGGLPVMGAIVRSAVNVQAGARTRSASCIHAVLLLAALLFGGALVSRVPDAALAAILIVVGVRLMDLKGLRSMWSSKRGEVVIVVVTAGAIALTSFPTGITLGIVAAAVLHLAMTGAVQLQARRVDPSEWQGLRALHDASTVELVALKGPLVFTSAARVDGILGDNPPWPRYMVVDLRQVWAVDSTGLYALEHVLECLRVRKGEYALVSAPGSVVAKALERTGLAARAVSMTASLEQALTAIAQHEAGPTAPAGAEDRRADKATAIGTGKYATAG
jgi:SulP family sulfate permease